MPRRADRPEHPNPIAERFTRARERIARTQGRELTAKEYLDTIDPTGHRTDKSARGYMRRLLKGERSGSRIIRRVEKNATGDRIFNVALRDKKGNIVDSANVTLPIGISTMDLYTPKGQRALKKAVNEYFKQRMREHRDPFGNRPRELHYRWRRDSRGLVIVGMHPIRNTTRTTVAVVRGAR